MFRYADRPGIFLYAIGMVCMAASGTALPLLDLIFGQFVNTFNVSPKQEPKGPFLTSFGRTLPRAVLLSATFVPRLLAPGMTTRRGSP
jgi:hypothetical protein